MERPFRDRRVAGWLLAGALRKQAPELDAPDRVEGPLVLGIPRGGAVVAAEVARELNGDLDVILARRLPAPEQAEVALGAVVEDEAEPLLDEELIQVTNASADHLQQETDRARAEIARQAALYRGTGTPLPIAGRTVILVDDGIATGATFRAALARVKKQGPPRLIAAVPVGEAESVARLHALADAVVCLESPDPFLAVAVWYEQFPQVTDEEVIGLLDEHRARHAAADEALPYVTLSIGEARLDGLLLVPPNARGIVLFAHGSGSGRHSPRNALVARLLAEAGLASLRLDLLTLPEQVDRENLFDIPHLAERLQAAAAWLQQHPATRGLPLGYFGASTGAAAALQAAAQAPATARALVSRGGRPSLASEALPQVTAPTCLLVGSEDPPTLAENEAALAHLPGPRALHIIPGAGHLFEEPGALEEAARLARDWFLRYLT